MKTTLPGNGPATIDMKTGAETSGYSPFRRLIPLILCLPLLLGACALPPVAEAPLPTFTEAVTPTEPAGTPTPTIVWFPPTATFTPFPSQLPMSGASPTPESLPDYGELIFSDSFDDEVAWTTGRTTTGSASITNGELTLAISQPGGYLFSLRGQPSLRSFYAEITASPSLCKGADAYGLLLRVTESLEFYRFSLSCDGQVRLDKYYNGRASSPQPPTPSAAVPPGAPSSSRIGVWAAGREMRFYVNGEHQFTVNDPSIESGQIGVFARSEGTTPVTINFSDLVVYQPTN